MKKSIVSNITQGLNMVTLAVATLTYEIPSKNYFNHTLFFVVVDYTLFFPVAILPS